MGRAIHIGKLTSVIRFSAIALVVWLAATTAAWASVSRDALVASEARLLSDAADGNLDDHELLVAALVAGGVDDLDAAQARARALDAWLAQFDAEPLPSAARERAAVIFARLHGELLTGNYQATCSDVAVALDIGDFNCLSATILYVCAARHCGLAAKALATDGHVFCEIAGESGSFEVETTCPKWFTLAQSDALAAKELRLAPQSGGAARPREVRRLSDVELLAKVYYNRGVAALRENDYARGLALTRTSLQLDPHDAVARGNVLAGLNNWALALCRQGDPTRAAELLVELRQLDPNYPTLADNEAHIEQAKAQATIGADAVSTHSP